MQNRNELQAVIAAALVDSDEQVPNGGVLLVRTQRLREFELLFGYEAGDRLRQAMSERLGQAVRSIDRVIEIGECDFAVVLPRLHDRQHAALAASKVSRVLREPFEILGRPARASVLVGVATWPQDGVDPEQLCRNADHACTQARGRRERHALFAGNADVAVSHDALHDAILRNQLEVYLQPLHSVDGDALAGFESLARWNTPAGPIPPTVFIQVAEQTGLIDELTRWSIHTTLRHCAPLLQARPGLKCAINLSPRAVLEHGIVEQIASSLKIWGVAPASLVVEITETAFVDNAEAIAEVLGELHATGIGIAIDDYGTGYSSLNYLRHFPVTELKIDRSFVADLRSNPRSLQLVAAMVELAHRLGAVAVAEGVEDQAELDLLRGMGCDQYQGYLKARPEPADDLIARLMGAAT